MLKHRKHENARNSLHVVPQDKVSTRQYDTNLILTKHQREDERGKKTKKRNMKKVSALEEMYALTRASSVQYISCMS